MASDAQEPTRRKHRRSSPENDDVEEPSKRRKHRHHRHRHHHRRHSSRKHGEEEGVQIEGERKREDEDEDEASLPHPLPPPQLSSRSNLRPNYDDMEEGEIVEEDEEFGEIKAAEVRSESENRNSVC